MHKRIKHQLPIIDFAKGIAAIMIVLTHSTISLEGISWNIKNITNACSMGCQLFFLASGILAFFSLNKENFSIKKFYLKKIINIIPAYYLMVVIYCSLDFVNNGERTFSLISIILNVLMLHGILVVDAKELVPGGWFIGVLVVFYVLSPILLRGVLAVYKKTKKYFFWIVLLYFILMVGNVFSIFLCNTMFNGKMAEIFNISYTSWICQLCPFVIGLILGYQLQNDELPHNRLVCKGLFLISLVLSLITFYDDNINIRIRVYFWTLLYYFGFIILKNVWDYLKDRRIIVQISKWGEYSYAVFFVHFVICAYIFPVLEYVLIEIGCNNGNIRYVFILCIGMMMIYIVSKSFNKLINSIQKLLWKLIERYCHKKSVIE